MFSWSGHFANMYFPSDKSYGTDYDFFKFPSTKNKNAMVGLGDSLVILNSSEESIQVFNSLTSNGLVKTGLHIRIQCLSLQIKIQTLTK